jgi:serine/threonine-protein kinase
MRAALRPAGDGPSDVAELTVSLEPADATAPRAAGALAALAESLGQIPRVLLTGTDTDATTAPDPVVQAASPEMPDTDDRSAHLQLFGEIARGGMGAVLKGRDVDLGRDLAVKVLLERHRDNPGLIRRFIEEAQIAGQLQHPGVVPVYELGAFADRRPFFVMKLVKGRTLSALLSDRPSPREDLPRFLAIFAQVCQTVAYAHARGVIHRDLKPSNVMVGAFGEVQVMDWGLAKVLRGGGAVDDARSPGGGPEDGAVRTVRSGSAADASQAGSVLGTPAFMAPEQAGGDVGAVDERADIFGLGSILCEILTGQPAYTGRTRQEVSRKASRGETAEALGRLRESGADAELLALARDCLAANRDHRPRDAGVIAARLTAYQAGVQDRPHAAELARVEAQARAGEEAKRRRLTVALAASLLSIAALVGGGWAWAARQRAGRVAATGREVNAALAEAADLRGQARAMPIGDLTRWDQALAAARHAASLLARGEGDAELHGRVRALLETLTRERSEAQAKAREADRDRRMVERLPQIHEEYSVHRDRARREADYVAAFRTYGIDVDALDPAVAGARIAARPIAVELAAALDQWIFNRRGAVPPNDAGAAHLVAVAKVADPDPWRNQLRDALGRKDVEALRTLAASVDIERLPPQSVSRLAQALKVNGEAETAVALLRGLQRRHRGDYWVNYDLAEALLTLKPPRIDEALRYHTAGAALRPQSAFAVDRLANTLEKAGQFDGAVAELRDDVRLNPHDALAHYNLARALEREGKFDEALAEWREATRLNPDDALAHYNLARKLELHGKGDEATTEFGEAIRLKPDDAQAYLYLGNNLLEQGKLDEAIAAFRQAVALHNKAQVSRTGKDWCSAALAQAERLAAQRPRLPAVLQGDVRPRDNQERFDFAYLCRISKRYAAASLLYAEALKADPRLTDRSADRQIPPWWFAYGGICSAALAGCGQGVDAPPLDDMARFRLRAQALSWLKAELVEYSKLLQTSKSADRTDVLAALRVWKAEHKLAGVRDVDALADLPELERTAWTALWRDVDALLAKAQGERP